MAAVLDSADADSAWLARAISSASAAANDGDDALSNGDIFGMFLTLCVCLVAQPSGSLLYRPWSLPIWRLNPLASLAEAVLIAYCFAVHILFVLLDSISTPTDHHARGRWQRSLSGLRLFYHHLVAEMHAVAAALLLIRSDVNRTEGTPADMVDEMITKGLFDENSDTDEDEDEEAQDASQAQTESGDLGHGVKNAADVGDASALNEPIRPKNVSAQDAGREEPYLFALRAAMLPGLRPAPAWTPPLLFYVAAGLSPGDRAADLGTSGGAADATADPGADAGAPFSTALRHALGAGVIAHREFTVQAATVLSILSITAKLFTSSLPVPLQICGLSMLAGWIAVQVVLVIFHAGHVDGTRMRLISRKVRDLQFLYRPPESDEAHMLSFTLPWLFALIPVAFPIIRLAIYCFTPSKDIGQEPTVLYLAGRWIFRILGTIVGVQPIPAPDGYATANKDSRDWAPLFRVPMVGTSFVGRRQDWPGLWGWIKTAIVAWLAAYGYASRFTQLGDTTNEDEDRPLVYQLTAGLTWIAGPALLILSVFRGTSMYPRPHRYVSLLSQAFGLLVSAYLFTAWLVAYDSGGASQPSWIKWLG